MADQHYHSHDKAGNEYGKLFPSDQGGLTTRVFIKDGHIVMDFGKDVSWLALHKNGAQQLIKTLQAMVDKL